MRKKTLICIILFLAVKIARQNFFAEPINREALVSRHNIIIAKADSLSSLTVGNGKFAFTVDVTGLQSFPGFYANGIPLGTESEWGWHSFPNIHHYKFEESLRNYHLNGRDITYSVQWNEPGRNRDAANWFRQNPHRLQLGNIGFEIKKGDGSIAQIDDLKNIYQQLNLWKGEIHSVFSVDNAPVDVITLCHQKEDAIAVKVKSDLLEHGRLQVRVRFPYPTGDWSDAGNYWAMMTSTSLILH